MISVDSNSRDARVGEIEALGRDGWFVRERWIDDSMARHAAASARVLSGFEAAGIGRAQQKVAWVRRDERIWIDAQTPPEGLRPVIDALARLKQSLNGLAFLGLDRTELQLARYTEPGALYQRHRDSLRGAQGRRVTAIYYLNEAWRPEHGGALRLHPESREPVDVSPRLNTLVVFLSEQLEHEVLPSHHERYALTAWWSS
ncbi:MAG: 2OG-Fe(II) oxygenase [Myxococcaceae bacterium]